jgi:polyhydroxyalkanoate synthase
MSLYDLFPERSFVRYLLASGFPVYLVDWGTPDRRHDTLNMADYFAERLPAFLRAVRQHSGHQNLSLHGWSFGGLFSYAYTALTRDPHIRNLVLVGAPCDYHANGTLGKQYQRLSHTMNWLNQRTRFRVHNTPPGLWRASGMSNALAFKLTSPAASINSYIKLLKQLDDTDYVVQHATNSAFLDQMVAYPGACIQDIVQYLLTENLLARGRLPLPNRPALLADIDASILMITGNQDTVITRNCSHALLKQVCSKDITTQEINGGHMSIVGGPEAARESWPFIVNWLAARDAQAQSATDRKRRVTAK